MIRGTRWPPIRTALTGRFVAGMVVAVLMAGSIRADDGAARRVADVSPALRKTLGLASFYRRHLDLRGFPILASSKPPDRALLEAAWIIDHMLAKRPDILTTMRKRGLRCCVMAHDERTTMVPEHASLEPARWWDYRARGLGPEPSRMIVSCAEENLLGYQGDPHAGESILVHEFAHAIDSVALRRLDTGFAGELAEAYENAMAKGLWKGAYAATNQAEYFAEGVQSWFDTNRSDDAMHNHVNTREELERYDPGLACLISKTFGRNPWRYVPVERRVGRAHLKAYDPTATPAFRWPDGLADWFRKHESKPPTGEGLVELAALPTDSGPTRSPASSASTHIVFVNRTDGEVRIHWLDHEGDLRPYGALRMGERAERKTFTGHLWVVQDDRGSEIVRFRADRTPGRAVIKE